MVDIRGKSNFAYSLLFTKKNDIPLEYYKNSEDKLDQIIKTIENPNEIIEEAIKQCFNLFQISEKDFKKFTSEDGEVEFRNDSRILNISYKKVEKNKNSKILSKKVAANKVHAYEIDWVIFNVTWDKWSEKIRQIYGFIINQSMSRIPGLGGILGDFINKKIKSTGDKWIRDSINYEFNEIFYTILKSNPGIEYIQYQDKKLIKSNQIFS